MKPIQREYEKLPTGTFLTGMITKVERDAQHEFTFKGEKKTGDAVRFWFNFDEAKSPKVSRWMNFNYSEKSNLYKKYLLALVEGATPNMNFDVEQLVGMKIKTIWMDDKDPKYQSIQLILPLDKKVVADPDFVPSEEQPF